MSVVEMIGVLVVDTVERKVGGVGILVAIDDEMAQRFTERPRRPGLHEEHSLPDLKQTQLLQVPLELQRQQKGITKAK